MANGIGPPGLGLGILDLIGELSGGPQGIQAQMDETQAGSDVDRLIAALRDQQFEATDPEPISKKHNALNTIATMLSGYAAAMNPRIQAINYGDRQRDRRLQDANRQTALDRQQFQDSRQLALMELRDMIGQRDTAQRRADALGREGRDRVAARGREASATAAKVQDELNAMARDGFDTSRYSADQAGLAEASREYGQYVQERQGREEANRIDQQARAKSWETFESAQLFVEGGATATGMIEGVETRIAAAKTDDEKRAIIKDMVRTLNAAINDSPWMTEEVRLGIGRMRDRIVQKYDALMTEGDPVEEKPARPRGVAGIQGRFFERPDVPRPGGSQQGGLMGDFRGR